MKTATSLSTLWALALRRTGHPLALATKLQHSSQAIGHQASALIADAHAMASSSKACAVQSGPLHVLRHITHAAAAVFACVLVCCCCAVPAAAALTVSSSSTRSTLLVMSGHSTFRRSGCGCRQQQQRSLKSILCFPAMTLG